MEEYSNAINSEGGPFLIADGEIAQMWRGCEERGTDWQRAFDRLMQDPRLMAVEIEIGSEQGIIWDAFGAGTAFFFKKNEGHFILCRFWLYAGQNVESAVMECLSAGTEHSTPVGILRITTGTVAVLWAAESGACIESLVVPDDNRPTGEMATGSSAFIGEMPVGEYRCLCDAVDMDRWMFRRCHFMCIT